MILQVASHRPLREFQGGKQKLGQAKSEFQAEADAQLNWAHTLHLVTAGMSHAEVGGRTGPNYETEEGGLRARPAIHLI